MIPVELTSDTRSPAGDRRTGAGRDAHLAVSPRSWGRAASLLLLGLLAATAPVWASPLWLRAAMTACIYAVAVLSVVVLRRSTGAISLAQASLMGVGAYATAWAADAWDVPLVVAAAAAVVLTVAIGATITLPAIRVEGMQLSILTLTVALAANALVFNAGAPLALNSNASASLAAQPSILGVELNNPDRLWWFQIGATAALFALVSAVLHSRTGTVWKVLTTSLPLAQASGVRVIRYRLLGFCLSAGLAATAGVMLLIAQRTVTAAQFSVPQSLAFVVFAMLGGLDRPRAAVMAGGIIGAGGQILQAFDLGGELVSVVLGFATVAAIVSRAHRLKATETSA